MHFMFVHFEHVGHAEHWLCHLIWQHQLVDVCLIVIKGSSLAVCIDMLDCYCFGYLPQLPPRSSAMSWFHWIRANLLMIACIDRLA